MVQCGSHTANEGAPVRSDAFKNGVGGSSAPPIKRSDGQLSPPQTQWMKPATAIARYDQTIAFDAGAYRFVDCGRGFPFSCAATACRKDETIT
mmetsp:Transcript_3559/g.6183  ORF Transcript_3559/g.6183 Transcript_3559/m.6183 type:complete len:93 (+) Transcript_3559:494-772(+)